MEFHIANIIFVLIIIIVIIKTLINMIKSMIMDMIIVIKVFIFTIMMMINTHDFIHVKIIWSSKFIQRWEFKGRAQAVFLSCSKLFQAVNPLKMLIWKFTSCF